MKSVFSKIMLLVIPALMSFSAFAGDDPDIVDLCGQWQFRASTNSSEEWLSGTVPGCVHTDLMDRKVIPDPFIGRNEIKVQFIEEINWIYRKTFKVSDDLLNKKRIDLVCEGLDTVANVKINGKTVGSSDNMYCRYVWSIADVLKKGENTVEIEFISPIRYVENLPERRYGALPSSNDRIGGSPFVRKAPYHFGWDWGPRLVTCGIWRPIYIIATDLPKIDFVTHQQKHSVDKMTGARKVKVEVSVEIVSPSAFAGNIECSIGDVAEKQDIDIPAGKSKYTLPLDIENPELWWPAGHGEQKLYPLKTVLSVDENVQTIEKKVGFRTIDLKTRKDDQGFSFVVTVNGRNIFCKGANWIPCDSFPSRVTPEKYRSFLKDAVDCNMNMIRVWGGGIYEDDVFYDICDELGLMVWQDFMFSCSVYAGDNRFLNSVRDEVVYNIKRLMNHPSLALYCGNNECETAVLRWYQMDSTRWRSYERIFHELIPEACVEIDPSRDYWPASPHSIESSDPGASMDGDCHVWDVWHGAKKLEYYQTIPARFVSEFGFQSFPSIETIKSYAMSDGLNLTAPDVEFHQKNDGGNRRILLQMMDRFRMPNGFENFVVLSQLQQALAMQIAVEHWRRMMPVCTGTLYWQLDDCWPVTSWSSIDYYGRWKALQYFARRFYEPTHVSAVERSTENGGADIVLTHDSFDELVLAVNWKLLTYNGDEIASGQRQCRVKEPVSGIICNIPFEMYLVEPSLKSAKNPNTRQNSYLSMTVLDAKGNCLSRNVCHFADFKDIDLPKPDLELKVRKNRDGAEITVKTDVFAKWVWLEAEGSDGTGKFSDNYFDMNPGESRVITYKGDNGSGFKVKSLFDTYQ